MHLHNLFGNSSTIQALSDNPIANLTIRLISALSHPRVLKITLNGMSEFRLSQISDAIGSQRFVPFNKEKFEALCGRAFEGTELVGSVFQKASDLGLAITQLNTAFSTKVEPELYGLLKYMTLDSSLLRMLENVFIAIERPFDDRELRGRLTDLMRKMDEISYEDFDKSCSFRNSLFAFSRQIQSLAAPEEGGGVQPSVEVSQSPPDYGFPSAPSRAEVCCAPVAAMPQPCCAPCSIAVSHQPLTGFKTSLLEMVSNHMRPVEVTDARLFQRILQLSEMTETPPECIRWITKKVLKTVAQVSSHIPEVIDAHIFERSIALSKKTEIPYEYIQWIARKILKTAQGY
jgi:hypothetical protein